MKLIDLQEAKYAASRITVRVTTDILWVIENLLYDRDTLSDHFRRSEYDFWKNDGDDIDLGFDVFEDYVVGWEHDDINLIKIKDGYAHDRSPDPNPPKPDYVILEESFDQAIHDGWLEIIK